MNKVTMELVWHDCVTCPPEEESNENLIMTDGKSVWNAEYERIDGDGEWFKDGTHSINVNRPGKKYWWADLLQTTKGFFGKK